MPSNTEPSAAMRKFADLLRARPPAPASVTGRRRQMEQAQARLSLPADVRSRDFSLAGRRARWFETPASRGDHVVLYLHGGAYMMGSLATHGELMARIARACRCRVLGIDYRLAPEFPAPAALDDALAAYRWLLAQGVAPARLMLGGDSAGGGLALATLMALRDGGEPLPAGALLLSPWTDLSGSGASMTARAEADPMLDAAFLREAAALYCAGTDPRAPGVSPHFGDFCGLPPLLIQAGDAEILLDDSTRAAAAARSAGARVELAVWSGAFHVFQSFPQLPESTEALAMIGEFFARNTAAQ